MKNIVQSRLGFTLIELLVVVLIIGILSAVALPQYQKAVFKARASEVLPMLKRIYQETQLYEYAHPGVDWDSVDDSEILGNIFSDEQILEADAGCFQGYHCAITKNWSYNLFGLGSDLYEIDAFILDADKTAHGYISIWMNWPNGDIHCMEGVNGEYDDRYKGFCKVLGL